jgi:nitrate reductase delta subunit
VRSLSGPATGPILTFLHETSDWGLEAAQKAYVGAFDFNRRASLHLTYMYQGDRRQRGVALLKLRRLYARLGLDPLADELPDFLPLMLELADMLAPAEAVELLGEYRAAIELIDAALRDQRSPYRHLLAALRSELGAANEQDIGQAIQLASDGPPSEQVGLEPFGPVLTGAAS